MRGDFLGLLCQFPPAKELRISVQQMRDVCETRCLEGFEWDVGVYAHPLHQPCTKA